MGLGTHSHDHTLVERQTLTRLATGGKTRCCQRLFGAGQTRDKRQRKLLLLCTRAHLPLHSQTSPSLFLITFCPLSALSSMLSLPRARLILFAYYHASLFLYLGVSLLSVWRLPIPFSAHSSLACHFSSVLISCTHLTFLPLAQAIILLLLGNLAPLPSNTHDHCTHAPPSIAVQYHQPRSLLPLLPSLYLCLFSAVTFHPRHASWKEKHQQAAAWQEEGLKMLLHTIQNGAFSRDDAASPRPSAPHLQDAYLTRVHIGLHGFLLPIAAALVTRCWTASPYMHADEPYAVCASTAVLTNTAFS